MLQLDLIVRNGFLVLTDDIVKADIGIKDGIIVQIEENIQSYGKEEYDAYGQYIFPGMIDVHVHFSEPGREHWEGFKTGTQMLAAGGCTTFFDMPLNGIFLKWYEFAQRFVLHLYKMQAHSLILNQCYQILHRQYPAEGKCRKDGFYAGK